MKILYHKIENEGEVLGKVGSSTEELVLPPYIFTQLEEDLNSSDEILPEPAKRVLPGPAMKLWRVALLDRFDPPINA